MKFKYFTITLVSVLLPCFVSARGITDSCDRTCLESYMDRYMEAMLENDPSIDLFSRDCKFTENGVRLPLGNEGLWLRMTGKGSYKFYVPDVETQQVALSERPGKAMAAGREKTNLWPSLSA